MKLVELSFLVCRAGGGVGGPPGSGWPAPSLGDWPSVDKASSLDLSIAAWTGRACRRRNESQGVAAVAFEFVSAFRSLIVSSPRQPVKSTSPNSRLRNTCLNG